jgi:hypothetical protein
MYNKYRPKVTLIGIRFVFELKGTLIGIRFVFNLKRNDKYYVNFKLMRWVLTSAYPIVLLPRFFKRGGGMVIKCGMMTLCSEGGILFPMVFVHCSCTWIVGLV